MKSLTEIFSYNLRRIRKELGLSQEKFAEKIDMQFRNLSSIETGKHLSNSINLQKICDNLHILPEELFKIPDEFAEEGKCEILKKLNDKLSTYELKTLKKFYNILLCLED